MGVQKFDEVNHGKSNMKVKSAAVTTDHSPRQVSVDVPPGVQRFDDDGHHMRSDLKVFDGKDKPMPTRYNPDIPPGVQSYDDNGQKEGSTRYMKSWGR